MADEQNRLGGEENFYTLIPEQGLCLVGNTIVNLKNVSLVLKQDGKTLVYCAGVAQPVALPGDVFDQIREAAFSIDDLDELDDDDLDEELDEEG